VSGDRGKNLGIGKVSRKEGEYDTPQRVVIKTVLGDKDVYKG